MMLAVSIQSGSHFDTVTRGGGLWVRVEGFNGIAAAIEQIDNYLYGSFHLSSAVNCLPLVFGSASG